MITYLLRRHTRGSSHFITLDLINSQVLSLCKRGVKLVNVARGGIIDEKSLLDALNSGQCAGAALDVFEEEPPVDRKLIEHPSVICTPHLGANTREAQKRVAIELAQQIIDFQRGHSLIGVVNGSAVISQFSQGNRPILLLTKRLGQILARSSPTSSTTLTGISLSFNRSFFSLHRSHHSLSLSLCSIRYRFQSPVRSFGHLLFSRLLVRARQRSGQLRQRSSSVRIEGEERKREGQLAHLVSLD